MTEKNRRNGVRAAPVNRGSELKRSSGKRKKKKRRRDAFIIVCALLLLASVGAVFSLKFLFKTESIAVENSAERYSDESILEAAGIKTGGGLFEFSAKKAARNVEKQLPYIGKCTVKRRLPDTVAVAVEYTRPAMAAQTVGGYILIDKNGKVLEQVSTLPADYIAVLKGVNVTGGVPGETVAVEGENVLQYISELACAFDENGIKNITAYSIAENGDVTVEIDYATDLKLGTLSKASSKVRFAKEVLADNPAPPADGDRNVIDITEGTKAYVRSQKAIDAASEAASIAEASDIAGTKPDIPAALPETTGA